MRRPSDIHPAHVGLFGVHQGAWICLLAAVTYADIPCIITVSGAGNASLEQDVHYVEHVMLPRAFQSSRSGRQSRTFRTYWLLRNGVPRMLRSPIRLSVRCETQRGITSTRFRTPRCGSMSGATPGSTTIRRSVSQDLRDTCDHFVGISLALGDLPLMSPQRTYGRQFLDRGVPVGHRTCPERAREHSRNNLRQGEHTPAQPDALVTRTHRTGHRARALSRRNHQRHSSVDAALSS